VSFPTLRGRESGHRSGLSPGPWRSYPLEEVARPRAPRLGEAGLSISPDVALGEFNASTRTLVAIARALQDISEPEGNILVLDEPTSALPVKEVAALLAALRTFTDLGVAVLLIPTTWVRSLATLIR